MGRSRGHSRAGLARVCGDDGLPSEWFRRRRRRQAGSGMARNRARAPLNGASQGQRWGRCRVGGAPSGVGPALAQPRHQHVAGAAHSSPGPGQQRVIATRSGVAMVSRSFLGQPMGLADGGVQVDGQRRVVGSRLGRPGPGKQLPAHPVGTRGAHLACSTNWPICRAPATYRWVRVSLPAALIRTGERAFLDSGFRRYYGTSRE